MKQSTLLLLAMSLLFVACKTKKNEPKKEEAISMQKDLETMSPYGPAKLAAFFPEELGGIKRTSMEFFGDGIGGMATYVSPEAKELELRVYDCAGKGYAMCKMNVTTFTSSMGNPEYLESYIELNGIRAKESHFKGESSHELRWPSGGRMWVNLSSKQIGLEELKKIVATLHPDLTQRF